MTCTIHKLRRKRNVQVLVFLFLLAIDSADMINDWLFYNDMNLLQKGLVFGPIESSLLNALLVFSIIGVLTFLLEVILVGREIFKPDKGSWIDIDYVSTVTVWIEEVPQITISVIIASCREEAVSIFQISKASVVIIGCILRLIIAIIRFCFRRRKENYENKKIFKSCYAVLLVGLILSVIGSIMVFIFSHALSDGGQIKFQEPTEFLKMKHETTRYYDQVGIYLDGRELPINAQTSMNYDWIKLVDLTDIEKNIYLAKKIKFSKTGSTKIQIQTILDRHSKPPKVENAECYDKNDKWVVSNTSQCPNLFDTNEITGDVTIYFNFIQQTKHLIMGDVKYNTLYTTPSTGCSDSSGNYIELPLKYFKAKTMKNDTFPKFYKLEDLVPISEAWQTGFTKCKSSGSESPHWDNSTITVNYNCWS